MSPPTELWGAQLRILSYAPELRARGIALTLGSPAAGDFHAAWVAAGLPHRDLDVPAVTGIRDPETGRRPGPGPLLRTGLGVGRGLSAVVRAAGDFDVVWSFSLRTHASVALAGRIRRTPTLIEVVDIVRPGAGRRVLQFAGRTASATIVNSEATGAALEGRARQLHVVHPGVDVDEYRPRPVDPRVRRELGAPGGVLVGIVGRLDPMKGIHVLVDSLEHVPADLDVKLAVIGDRGVRPDGYARELQASAAERFGDRVRFVGRRSDVPRVLGALDILVNASAAEPFGRSVLEAQATGIAVIVGSAGGTAEFVADDETGIVVPPNDPVALGRAITALARDPGLRQRLGDAGRVQAVEHFDIASRYERVADILHELARS